VIAALLVYALGVMLALVAVGIWGPKEPYPDIDGRLWWIIGATVWPFAAPALALALVAKSLLMVGESIRKRERPSWLKRKVEPQEPVCPICKSRGPYR
jgi:hypothetical protein